MRTPSPSWQMASLGVCRPPQARLRLLPPRAGASCSGPPRHCSTLAPPRQASFPGPGTPPRRLRQQLAVPRWALRDCVMRWRGGATICGCDCSARRMPNPPSLQSLRISQPPSTFPQGTAQPHRSGVQDHSGRIPGAAWASAAWVSAGGGFSVSAMARTAASRQNQNRQNASSVPARIDIQQNEVTFRDLEAEAE